MLSKEKILNFFTKDELVEALMHSTITNSIFVELVRARMNQNNKRADKLLEENNKILSRLTHRTDIKDFIQAQKELDENYQKFNEIMHSNEAIENWMKEYEKELDELEDYV